MLNVVEGSCQFQVKTETGLQKSPVHGLTIGIPATAQLHVIWIVSMPTLPRDPCLFAIPRLPFNPFTLRVFASHPVFVPN